MQHVTEDMKPVESIVKHLRPKIKLKLKINKINRKEWGGSNERKETKKVDKG